MAGRVDFYVLQSAAPGERRLFACRLTEKAYLRNLRVVVLAGSDADAQGLDDLLWTFSERSFVPHAIYRDADSADSAAPVQLTATADGGAAADLLINLSNRMPPLPQRYARIAEIVDADAERRRLVRERFKSYRDLKFELETHQLGSTLEI